MTTRLLTVLALASAASVVGLVTQTAAAADCGDRGCAPSTSGNTVTVRVSGSLVSGGSDGSSGGGATTVSVPTPCFWQEGWTGKRYADLVDSGRIGSGSGNPMHGGDPDWQPYEGYQKHADDTEGYWYYAACSNVTDMPNDEFTAFATDFIDENDGVWVEPGDAPPVPEIPPQVLLAAAQEAMEVPEPGFENAPDLDEGFDTLVNVDTWFWLTDPTQSGSVTAEAAGNSVTVDADLADVTFSSPTSSEDVACDGTGVAWSPAASSDCTLTFASAGPTEVTADTSWDLTWSYNGEPQGAIDPLVATFTDGMGVGESQALVDEVG